MSCQVFGGEEAPVLVQPAPDRFPRHAPLEASARGVEQDQARPQPHDQRPVRGVFPLDLAGLRRQHMLERAAVVCNPAPPLPGPDQAGCRDGRDPTEQIVGEQR